MRLFLDSLWRALAYCFMPRVITLSLVPLALLLVTALGWGYFYWEPTKEWVKALLDSWQVLQAMLDWMQAHGAGDLQVVLVPLVVIFAITPLLVLLSLLAVSLMMTPALVNFVVQRRFAHLALYDRRGAGDGHHLAFVGCAAIDVCHSADHLGMVELPRHGV